MYNYYNINRQSQNQDAPVTTLRRLCENDKSEKKCETKTRYFVCIPAFAGMTRTLGSVIAQSLQRCNL